MAFESISPNMNLPVPAVGQTIGPDFATDINNSLNIIDIHDHSPGYGVPVTPDGLSISSDLSIENNNLTDVRSMRMQNQSSALILAADVRCLNVVSGNLYYNNSSGTAVQITSGGSIVGTAGSITGLPSGTAGAAYSSGSQTFVWTSATVTPANMDFASAILRNLSASSYGLTLAPPAAMAADTTVTLPSLPASKKIMTMSSAGAMAAEYSVDNSTIEVSSNTIQLKDGGITNAKVNASAAIAYSKLNLALGIVNADVSASAAIAQTKLGQWTYEKSLSSGSFTTSSTGDVPVTNLSITLNSSGQTGSRLRFSLGPSTQTSLSQVALDNPGSISGYITGVIRFYQDSTIIAEYYLKVKANGASASGIGGPSSAYSCTIPMPSSGSKTYTVRAAVLEGTSVLSVTNCALFMEVLQ